MRPDATPISKALELVSQENRQRGVIPAGYDVFGIPHGGYLAALAGRALLRATGQPELFTQTAHFIRKAVEGPIWFEVETVASSRRFVHARAIGRQDDRVVITVTGSLGDASAFSGPDWAAEEPWHPRADGFLAAGAESAGAIQLPEVARRFQLALDPETVGFLHGAKGPSACIRAIATPDPIDPLTALAASDLTPPAIWNALGMEGWVPTVELTTHIRARPTRGPLRIEAVTRHVSGGFLEEDALVHDGDGRLIVQSRQLACYTQPRH